jgi:DNA-binding transcriptional LysR family regulator
MQFESLKVFCDVARFRSFSQAAQSNNVSQSAASQIVLQLERRLGVQLVNRSIRPLQLTPLGKAYYEGCKGLVKQYQELEASIRDAQDQLDIQVQVAAIYSVGLGDMGKYIDLLAARQPNAKVQIEYLHPDRVYEKVLEGTADFGLLSFPRKSRELSALPWRDEEMVLACSPEHPLARQKAIKPAQLEGLNYVAFDKGLVIRREVDRFLRDQDISVIVTLEFDNIENIKKAVQVSAGVALLPRPTLRAELEAGTLAAVPLAGVRFVRPLGIIQRRHSKLSSAALRFIDILRHQNELNGNGERDVSTPRYTRSGVITDPDRTPSRNGVARKKKK